MRPKFLFVLITVITLNQTLCVNYNKLYSQIDKKTWKYFRIYADCNDAPFFRKLLDEFGLSCDSGYNKYQLVVNIGSKNSEDRYIVLGRFDSFDVELDPNAFRWYWDEFSLEVRNGLINWKSKNKINLEKR